MHILRIKKRLKKYPQESPSSEATVYNFAENKPPKRHVS